MKTTRKSFSPKARSKFLTDASTGDLIRCSRPNCGCPAEHIHHIIAVVDGGSDEPSNLQMLCQHHHVELHSTRGDFAKWGARGGSKTADSMKGFKNLPQFRGPAGEIRLAAYIAKKVEQEMGMQ